MDEKMRNGRERYTPLRTDRGLAGWLIRIKGYTSHTFVCIRFPPLFPRYRRSQLPVVTYSYLTLGYLPLCSPRKTSLNFRSGFPKSPDDDIVAMDSHSSAGVLSRWLTHSRWSRRRKKTSSGSVQALPIFHCGTACSGNQRHPVPGLDSDPREQTKINLSPW